MTELEARYDGRYIRAELEERDRVDCSWCDDLWRDCAIRATVQGDQEEGGCGRILALRLSYSSDRQHASYTILVCTLNDSVNFLGKLWIR